MGSASRALTLRVTFKPTIGQLAQAMALDARDTLTDEPWGDRAVQESPRFTQHVQAMTRADALAALRSCLWSYGHLSWPDDYPQAAYRAALEKARGWSA